MELSNKFGWQHIDGWFNFAKIYDQIIREADKNDIIIEVGCHDGKSTCYLAARTKMSGKNVKIIAIDKLNGNLTKIMENLTLAGVVDYASISHTTSEVAAYNTRNETVNTVFIDNCHYDTVLKEIKHWYPKIKAGGKMFGYNVFGEKLKDELCHLGFYEEYLGSDESLSVWKISKPILV